MQFAVLLSLAGVLAAPETKHWTVDGVAREALVVAPEQAEKKPSPVVFVFHGHGGSMRNAVRSFHLHEQWPEAIVVYPQGLNTPSRVDPEGKRAGWQSFAGGQADRDLKFFDAMLSTIKDQYQVDQRRIYATGHSNGAIFTYLLWGTRPELFAAVATSSAPKGRVKLTQPVPAFHIAGEQDRIAPFALQKATIDEVRKLNGCAEKGEAWAPGCLCYASPTETPLVTLIHSGGHAFPKEAPALIVKFFQEHQRPTAKTATRQ